MKRALFVLIPTLLLAAVGSTWGYFSAQAQNPSNSVQSATSFRCSYSATVLATAGLVNYWRLGETSGTTAVDSKGTSNGTYAGGVTLNAADAIAGDTNPAVIFDGSNDSVDVPDTAALRLNGSWSLEWWGKAITFPGSGFPGVFYKGNSASADGWIIWYERGGSHRLRYKRNNVDTQLNNTIVTNTGFRHFVLTYDGTTLRAYVNGAQTDSVVLSWPTNNGTDTLSFGVGDFYSNSSMDEVAVYNAALSAATVQDHFRCGQRYRDVVLDTSGLVADWRLNELWGPTAYDTLGTTNGTYAGGMALGATGTLTAPNNTAVTFDGVDDDVGFGDVLDFAGTASFSVEAWFKRGTLGEATLWRFIAAKNNSDSPRQGWTISIGPNSGPFPQRILFERWRDDTEDAVWGTTATVAGTWYHVVCTYDGATMRVYMGGLLEASVASTKSLLNTTLPLYLGRLSNANSQRYQGDMDEVAIYNRALAAQEVSDHYAAR